MSRNPYIAELYAHITSAEPEVEVEHFQLLSSWRRRADVVHVHWPEAAVDSPSTIHSLTKSILVVLTLAAQKRRGAALIWTCHNLEGHDRRHPRLERRLRSLFEAMVDGVVHLSDESLAALAATGRLVDKPAAVIPHGAYRESGDAPPDRRAARDRLGLDADVPVLAFVGQIRPYKGVPALIRSFAQLEQRASLIVSGRPSDDEQRAEVRRAAAGVDGLLLEDRWLSEEEIRLRIAAADALVLAHRDANNSGTAILALGLDRPVVVRPSGSLAGLAETVGREWIYPLTEPLSGPVLDDVVRWAVKDRASGPSLEAFDPERAAVKTIEFYRMVSAD